MEKTDFDLQMKNIQVAMEALDKQYGGGSVMSMTNADLQPVDVISTGALTLDLALGVGGLPRGRIVEIYGKEASGKTTLSLSVCAEAQKLGGLCLYIDAENALDPIYAQNIGVDMSKLYLSQPGYGEEAFGIMEKMIATGQFAVVVVDSVAALTPKAEIEADMEDNLMGVMPRMMGKGLRKISSITHETNTLVIFTNQLRVNMGYGAGGGSVTPGGKAMAYFTSVRLDLWSQKNKDSKGNVISVKTHAKVAKNKVGPPHREADFDIRFGKGLDTVGCIVDMGEMRGVLSKKGNWYNYGEVSLGNGRGQTITALEDMPDLLDEIKQKILAE